MSSTVRIWIGSFVTIPVVLVVGLPAYVYMAHGFGIRPDVAEGFLTSWWQNWGHFDAVAILRTLWTVLDGRSTLLGAHGLGVLASLSVLTGVIVTTFALFAPPPSRAHPGGQLGNARFASDDELAAAKRGIELGLSPRRKEPVRVPFEGNAISFAPPRTGKTSGLILPNLIGAERDNWQGPVVVIDPKGELYRMVAERRRALGHRVICLDPYGLAGGTDRWNPLADMQATQTAALSRMIGAMLVQTGEANQYFRQRATTVVRGAIVALLEEGPTTLQTVRDLLLDHAALIERSAIGDSLAVRALRDILTMDERSLAPILSTAQTSFDWLQDSAMEDVAAESTFTMEDIARGHADLFIVAPTDDEGVLAPWLRLVLGELFAAARRRRQLGDKRVVVFVDEAAVLGRFSQLLAALGELPGYGISLWTFWQTRGQIQDRYGEAGLQTFLGTAEITTVSDVSPTLVQEAASWSAAIGSQTETVETVSQSGPSGSSGTSKTPQRIPLMQPEAVSAMSTDTLLAFVRVGPGVQRPAILRKVRPHREARFTGKYTSVWASPHIGR